MLGMEKNSTETNTNGLSVIPQVYQKKGLGKEYKDMLVTTIHDWLKIRIFHLGIKHGVDLYNTTLEEDGRIVVDIVDTDKKKAVWDNINVSKSDPHWSIESRR